MKSSFTWRLGEAAVREADRRSGPAVGWPWSTAKRMPGCSRRPSGIRKRTIFCGCCALHVVDRDRENRLALIGHEIAGGVADLGVVALVLAADLGPFGLGGLGLDLHHRRAVLRLLAPGGCGRAERLRRAPELRARAAGPDGRCRRAGARERWGRGGLCEAGAAPRTSAMAVRQAAVAPQAREAGRE